jgi:hypothetical protein
LEMFSPFSIQKAARKQCHMMKQWPEKRISKVQGTSSHFNHFWSLTKLLHECALFLSHSHVHAHTHKFHHVWWASTQCDMFWVCSVYDGQSLICLLVTNLKEGNWTLKLCIIIHQLWCLSHVYLNFSSDQCPLNPDFCFVHSNT